ncbi:hypothetical protein [Actinoplanes sp. URMC 104]|uniref:hypothetical protein n=1 Tax=Actinoplanes sp. URMC 104 TaxID=3423409 RepID=UPI003F19F018
MAAQSRRADKEAKARELADAFDRILNLHRVEFPPARRPVAPAPPPVDRAAILAHYEQQMLGGIGLFKRAERAAAREQAVLLAEAEADRQAQRLRAQQAQWQRDLDVQWELLADNDPDTVLATLAEAFEDNEAPAAAVGVNGAVVSLVLLVPPATEAVPEQVAARTSAGNISLRKITATDRATYYAHFVFGQVLVTLREAFAIAPGLYSARVVVLRDAGRDAYGRPVVPCLGALTVTRASLTGIRWEEADAERIIAAVASGALFRRTGRMKELSPIDLSREPDISALIAAVDLDDLAEG